MSKIVKQEECTRFINVKIHLTDKRICDAITSIAITDGDCPPTINELAQSLALPCASVQVYVERACKRGKLRKSGSSHWLVAQID